MESFAWFFSFSVNHTKLSKKEILLVINNHLWLHSLLVYSLGACVCFVAEIAVMQLSYLLQTNNRPCMRQTMGFPDCTLHWINHLLFIYSSLFLDSEDFHQTRSLKVSSRWRTLELCLLFIILFGHLGSNWLLCYTIYYTSVTLFHFSGYYRSVLMVVNQPIFLKFCSDVVLKLSCCDFNFLWLNIPAGSHRKREQTDLMHPVGFLPEHFF